jgi:general secretion pathway protein K
MPLLLVLWTVALLTIIASGLQSSGTVSYTLARNAAEHARREAQAEAALNLAVLSLLDRPSLYREQPQTLRYEQTDFKIEIQDELGRIDLNHADAHLLANLFRAVGLASQEAQKLADRIIDWRDPDDLRRLNGAEAREYDEASAAHRPRNGSFQSKDELRLLLGMTPELFRKVEPVLTIHSGKPSIDSRVAPPLARRALIGDSNAIVAEPQSGGSIGHLAGRAFGVCILSAVGEVSLDWTAVIRLTGDAAKTYWLLEWRQEPCNR